MSPYRTHSPFNELRMRRLIRKQKRLDKRILQRASRRYHREQNISAAKDIGLMLFMMVFTAYAIISLVQVSASF